MAREQFETITRKGQFVAWAGDNFGETAIALMTEDAWFYEAINCMRDSQMEDKDFLGVYGRHWWGDSVYEENEPRTATREEILLYLYETGLSEGKNADEGHIIDKIDITGHCVNFKPKPCNLKPWQKVLVWNGNIWVPELFSHYDPTMIENPYRLIGGQYSSTCIPYEGNEDKLYNELPF